MTSGVLDKEEHLDKGLESGERGLEETFLSCNWIDDFKPSCHVWRRRLASAALIDTGTCSTQEYLRRGKSTCLRDISNDFVGERFLGRIF